MHPNSLYTRATAIANAIEAELKNLHYWESMPLPPEKFTDMGAFGSNTMSFTQWLQFILLSRIRETVNEKGTFPSGSMLGAYAIRELDGNPNAGSLHELLYQLDDMINEPGENPLPQEASPAVPLGSERDTSTISLGDTRIPNVVYTLAGLLNQFTGDDLESQLQTFDMFLGILSPSVRNEIADLIAKAAPLATDAKSRQRIEKAAADARKGLPLKP